MNEEKTKRHERMQIAFLILLTVAIISLIGAITVILKNKEMFQENPIAFGTKHYGFDGCVCQQGRDFFDVTEDGFTNTLTQTTTDLNLGGVISGSG